MSFPVEPIRLKFFPEPPATSLTWANGGAAAYCHGMLGQLQNQRGEPGLRTRALAALVIVGLVVLTAPIVVIPLVGWLMHRI